MPPALDRFGPWLSHVARRVDLVPPALDRFEPWLSHVARHVDLMPPTHDRFEPWLCHVARRDDLHGVIANHLGAVVVGPGFKAKPLRT